MIDPQKDYETGTRNDCTRDNVKTICANSSLLGYSTRTAKRGSWIAYEIDGNTRAGRVVGRVHCERVTYLEVITWDVCQSMAYVRWIDPATVRECYSGPHGQVLAFLTGEWKDARVILARQNQGFARGPDPA